MGFCIWDALSWGVLSKIFFVLGGFVLRGVLRGFVRGRFCSRGVLSYTETGRQASKYISKHSRSTVMLAPNHSVLKLGCSAITSQRYCPDAATASLVRESVTR